MRSRALTSAILPAIALPALAMGYGGHVPGPPEFGISRAVRLVTSTVSSIASPGRAPAVRHPRRSPPRYVVIDCRGVPVVRPRTFELACADGNDNLTRLRWTAWVRGYATASGTQVLNDCQPSCAQGRFRDYAVRVILWGSASVPGHPSERRYQTVTLLYTGATPSVGSGASQMAGPPSVTGNLWS